MRIASRPRPMRWTEECTAMLLALSADGYTDQAIADGIERRTGLRFHRNKVLQERRDRMIGTCWSRCASVECPTTDAFDHHI